MPEPQLQLKIAVTAMFDVKAAAFLPPQFAPTVDVAVRAFASAAMEVTSELHKFGEDFTLFHLGWFDRADGTFELFEAPEPLAKAIQFVGQGGSKG